MSTFYGQVEGIAKTTASRRGSQSSGIRASVQSYNGSLITALRYQDDILMLHLEASDGSDFYGHTVYDGPFNDFVTRVLVKEF